MHILRRVIVIVAVTVLVLSAAFVGVYLWQKPILLTGTGYAAHNACAVAGIAGRDDPESDLPENPLVPYLQLETDVDSSRDDVTLPAGLAPQTAWYAEGFGCTLADEGTADGSVDSNAVRISVLTEGWSTCL